MTRDLSFQEKALALDALARIKLAVSRVDGSWYVDQSGVVIVKGHTEMTPVGRGPTPDAAIEAHWRELTDLAPGQLAVRCELHAHGRMTVRWNGFMWEPML